MNLRNVLIDQWVKEQSQHHTLVQILILFSFQLYFSLIVKDILGGTTNNLNLGLV